MTTMCVKHVKHRIVFFDDAHTFGGAQIALGWAIRALLRNTDERIVCICTARTKEAIQEIVGQSTMLDFIECPGALPLNIVSFPLRLIPFVSTVLRLRRMGVRAWWVNLAGIEFCLAPLFVLKALGEVPHAWLHNTERFVALYRNASPVRRTLSRLRDKVADRWLFSLYPSLVTPSQATARMLQTRICGTTRPRVGHLYPTISRQAGAVHRSNSENGGPTETTISLFMIGRIHYGHKNNLAALASLKFLSDQGKSIALTMVGEGPDMEDFKLRAKHLGITDKISFLGLRKNPWDMVPEEAIVFIPSFYESMSLVAREAMLNGIRLVVSPIPVFHEWIPNQLIADDFSARAFAAKVVETRNLPKADLLAIYADALTKFSEANFVKYFMSYSEQ